MDREGIIDFSLYLITDRSLAGGTVDGLVNAVEFALRGGLKAVQLREKDMQAIDLLRLAGRLRALTRKHGARLFINDRVDVALLSGADGVHLPEAGLSPSDVKARFGRRLIVGRSCHSVEAVRQAADEGADFVTLGPVYDTPSKRAFGTPIGLEPLKRAAALDIPIFALGGIKKEQVGELIECGVQGVALISAILAARDIRGATESLIEEIRKNKKEVVLK